MPHWNTQDIVKLCHVPGVSKITTEEFGGGWDTTEVLLSFLDSEDGLSVQGFKFGGDELTAEQRDDLDLVHVVLRNWESDSHGGVQTENPVLAAAAAHLRKALRAMGFSVHDHYEDFY